MYISHPFDNYKKFVIILDQCHYEVFAKESNVPTMLGVSKRNARTPALCKASPFLQIKCSNFQNGLFRP